jgi:hypothetical protein
MKGGDEKQLAVESGINAIIMKCNVHKFERRH